MEMVRTEFIYMVTPVSTTSEHMYDHSIDALTLDGITRDRTTYMLGK